MAARPYVSLSLSLAVVALVLAPAAGSGTSVAAAPQQQPSEHKFLIVNKSSEPITVRLLHSDGALQKQTTINPGQKDHFKFSFCWNCCGHDKHRLYEVKTGSTLRATGDLTFTTKMKELDTCVQKSNITVEDENTADAWVFSTDYQDWGLTAVLTVRNSST